MPYYQLIIPHSTNCMREARIQLGMKEWGSVEHVRRRVYVKAKKNELVRLKNERAYVEIGERCCVCGKVFTKESVIARTKENRCVHEECLSEEERKKVIDLF